MKSLVIIAMAAVMLVLIEWHRTGISPLYVPPICLVQHCKVEHVPTIPD